MNIARLSVKNPVFANLMLAVMLIGGATAFGTMPREVFPEIPLDMIVITADYIGAPPEEVEKQITTPLENAVEGIENIDSISSQSYENVSVIEIKVRQGTDNIQNMIDDIKEEIDLIENYPEEAEDPRVILIESEIPVIGVAVSGGKTEALRRKVAEELKNRLMTIDGVARVQPSGLRDIEIWVEADPFRISAMNISMDQIAGAISSGNINLPAGMLPGSRHEFPLRTSSELKTAEDVSRVSVMRDNVGREVKVGDIAEVTENFEEMQTMGRVDGEDSMTLLVLKNKSGSTIEVANKVKELVEELQREVPPGIHLKLNQDSSRYIKQRLKTLYTSGAIGLSLVCMVLFLFLNWRMAIWTAVGIPASFAGALLVMDYIGLTVNMMTLFALILVLGMVVDDAIIVTENVYRYLLKGYSAGKSAVLGSMEVFWPIVAATSTTIAAFMPMILMTGIMGKFIASIPIVVTITLMASFVEAFLILPSHLADYAKPSGKDMEKETVWFRKIRRVYRSTIKILLAKRYATLTVILMVFAFTVYYSVYHMKFVLFSSRDLVGFIVKIEMPIGSSLEETGRALAKVESIAKTIPKSDIQAAISLVGVQMDPDTGRMTFGSHLAQTMFESTEFETPGRRNGYVVADEVREKVRLITGIKTIEVKKLGGGPPIGAALEARISGKDYKTLRAISSQLQDYLKTIDGVLDIKDNFAKGKSEINITPDPSKLSLYGLSERDIGVLVRTGFDGKVAATIKRGNDDIDVRVVFAEQYRNDIDFISQISLASSKAGKAVRLSSVADVGWKEGLSTINHFNRKRTIKVFAEVNNDKITSSELTNLVKAKFTALAKEYPGYSLDFGGETKEQKDSVESLVRASLLGVLLIYLILGTLFKSFLQPIIVISAIPFSFTGVVLGHELLGVPIGILSLIGLAALTGIVVNDSLVMVDFINQARIRGASRWLSILRSAFVRFRAVVLTSLTTILGLSTLAFKTTGQAAFLAPMAISIVFGLIFSTILTLIIIPCAYAILDDLMIRIYGPEGTVFRERET